MVGQGESRRLVRVSGAIRGELSRLLVKETNDPRLAWVTVTGVEVSADLRHAKVFVTATGVHDSKSVLQGLTKAAPFLQRELSRNVNLRYTPKLHFVQDTSFEEADKIEVLIREVHREKQEQTKTESESQTLARFIDESESILLATHRNPDGDGIGAVLGMSGMLRHMGKAHVTYCPDGVPKSYFFLENMEQLVDRLDPQKHFDLTILFDTADESLYPEAFPSPKKRGTLVVIDHHIQHGEMGDLVIRRKASSVGEILFELVTELVWPMDKHIAECLYTSIVSDTSSFRYTSTTPNTHRIAAELITLGARPWVVATHLFESVSLPRQRLLGEVLNTLKVSNNGRFASLVATPEMLTRANAMREELDGMINFGRAIDGVEISSMFRVEPDGDIKVSFRSKGHYDVGQLAARFSGGGHRNAAGCTLRGMDISTAIETVNKAIDGLFDEYGNALSDDDLS
jgi:phosphoesterase RecJ-like protein